MTQDHNVSRMLENQHCLELNDQNECSHVTPESRHTIQLMQVITKLFLDAPGGAAKEYSSASTVLTLLEQNNTFCHKNLLRLKLIYFYLFNNALKITYELASKKKTGNTSVVSPGDRTSQF